MPGRMGRTTDTIRRLAARQHKGSSIQQHDKDQNVRPQGLNQAENRQETCVLQGKSVCYWGT